MTSCEKRLVDRKNLRNTWQGGSRGIGCRSRRKIWKPGRKEREQIVLIRLATRLHNMRTIDYMDRAAKKTES